MGFCRFQHRAQSCISLPARSRYSAAHQFQPLILTHLVLSDQWGGRRHVDKGKARSHAGRRKGRRHVVSTFRVTYRLEQWRNWGVGVANAGTLNPTNNHRATTVVHGQQLLFKYTCSPIPFFFEYISMRRPCFPGSNYAWIHSRLSRYGALLISIRRGIKLSPPSMRPYLPHRCQN